MATITPQIVTVNATVTTAPASSTIQRSGALVSEGGTTLTTGTYQYCGTLAQVTAILSTAGNYQEVSHMAGTFFAQGSQVGVYVLELGTQSTPSDGIAALNTWIEANPNVFYAYCTPANWDTEGATFNTMAASYSNPTSKTYFFGTTSASTISAYEPTTKALVMTVPSPTATGTEFDPAALFYQWLSNNPSVASPAAPMGFRFLYGVTPWSLANNLTTIENVMTAFGNVILTGSEGGISTATLRNGTTMDGNQMMNWYAVDWLLLNADLDISAAIINGSNSGVPLYYNQTGINSLLAVANDVCADSVAFGLCLTANTTATPFSVYVAQNPSNYAAGAYNGFQCNMTSRNGFLTITFNLDIVEFAS